MRKASPSLEKPDRISQAILDNAPESIVMMDKNHKILRYNETIRKVLNVYFGKNISIGADYRDFVIAPLKQLYLDSFNKALKGRITDIETETTNENLSLWFHYVMKPVYDEKKKLLGISLSAIDITERKKAEDALRKSEQQYRSLIEQASDAIMITDFKGNFVSVNESLCIMFGYTKKQLLKMNVGALIYPEDLKARPMVYSRLEGGARVFSERRMVRKDGAVIDVEGNAKKIGDGRALAIIRDVTERKKTEEKIIKSEQKYRSLIEQASDPIMVTDFEGNFVDVNTRLCDTFGYTKEELLKMTIYQLVDPDQVKEKPIRFDFLATGQQLFSERRMKRRDGSLIEVEANVKKVDDNHVMAIARDVTERKKVQKELEKSYEELRRLSAHVETVREEERTFIAREIHDELGQQLTGLKMDLSSLTKKIGKENKDAHKKIAGMMSLLNETMKTVRHISSQLRPGILDDLGLTDAIHWQGSEFEKRTGIKCTFRSRLMARSVDKNLSTGIFRIYQETLTNIARHARAKKVDTLLEVKNDSIVLRVKDDGKGFNEAEAKNKKTLGLVGMKERAMMFGGEIRIESEKGKGTSVTLHVPLKISKG